ncbi:hypothetical protein DFP72DRAFT_206233 [Ephemerocybe angulata]|uniref:Uncharacterized protein n=1 Tax=Ephemerocybe angulata TaxID=980116 RepID=A0A8H6MGI0_9AGAR|nr:hypothetical protein DFP72DRAFT_206233 [Tulosesus angulatus]
MFFYVEIVPFRSLATSPHVAHHPPSDSPSLPQNTSIFLYTTSYVSRPQRGPNPLRTQTHRCAFNWSPPRGGSILCSRHSPLARTSYFFPLIPSPLRLSQPRIWSPNHCRRCLPLSLAVPTSGLKPHHARRIASHRSPHTSTTFNSQRPAQYCPASQTYESLIVTVAAWSSRPCPTVEAWGFSLLGVSFRYRRPTSRAREPGGRTIVSSRHRQPTTGPVCLGVASSSRSPFVPRLVRLFVLHHVAYLHHHPPNVSAASKVSNTAPSKQHRPAATPRSSVDSVPLSPSTLSVTNSSPQSVGAFKSHRVSPSHPHSKPRAVASSRQKIRIDRAVLC